MRVASSDISLRSSHVAEVTSRTTSTLRTWVGDQRPDFEGRGIDEGAARVRLSDAAQLMPRPPATPPADAVNDASDASDAGNAQSAQLAFLQNFVERLTGRRMRLFSADELSGGGVAGTQPSAAGDAFARRAAGGVEFEQEYSYQEFEQTEFAAEGTIHTEDGQTLHFELAVSQTRTYEEYSSVQLRAGDSVRKDPLAFNFSGTAAELLDARFAFDLDADGAKDQVPMLAGRNGFLALDENANGRIDSGAELFGARTGDGFAELAKYDEDGNQVIDENDSVFARLRIWTPDAVGGGSLETLPDGDVGALLLSRIDAPFELRSAANPLGAARSAGVYLREDGRPGLIQQLDLVV